MVGQSGIAGDHQMNDDRIQMGMHEKELQFYLDAYKHHFDLFIKGALIYFAIIGFIAGYVFRKEMSEITRYALVFFIAAFSVITAFGCVTSLSWLAQVKSRVHELNKAVGMAAFPLDGAKWIGRLVLAAAALFFIASIVALVGIKMGRL